jgi:type VI secretion system secreted protein VgrG
MPYTQQNVYLSLTTSLGADKLLIRTLQAEERMSGLYFANMELASEDAKLDFSQLLGQSATVSITLADGTLRHLHGIVARFAQAGTDVRFTTYYAELRPRLWLLTLTSDSRIFQNQTVPDIVQAVCTELGVTDIKQSLTGTYAAREYCVQYQETAFDFISRLLEDEGIFYFFEHAADKHTLVLADDSDAHQACPGLAAARYRKSASDAQREEDALTNCAWERQVTPTKYSLKDFNFTTPSTDLLTSAAGANGTRELFEYPGGHATKDAGDARAKRRIEAHEQPATVLRGAGYCKAFRAGYKFSLSGHDRSDLDGEYVLSRVFHSINPWGYSNSFDAYPIASPFRPPRLTKRPVIVGAQTAIVVGPSGEEIHTDQYGRVKVQFHWDRKGKKDENSSCWVRVAQGWAGKTWGAIFIPRIGQEVIVSFLEGDPDRPIVTGAVYNGEQTVPYGLPADATKSTIKSNSSKGGEGFNEIRFEDKKDSEELFIHAQKDMKVTVKNDRTTDIQHDETTTIKNSRTVTIQEADEKLVVDKGNRTVQVNTGNETHEVKGTRGVTVTGDETHTNQANFKQAVTGNHELEVTGNCTWKITGNLTIKVEGSIMIEAGMSLMNKAGMSLTNDAGSSLVNKSNGSLVNRATGSLINAGGGAQLIGAAGTLMIGSALVNIMSSNPT